MAIDRVLNSDSMNEQEESFNVSLRPTVLGECVGQENIKEKLYHRHSCCEKTR